MRPKGSSPRGFVPKPATGSSTNKRDQKINDGGGEGPGTVMTDHPSQHVESLKLKFESDVELAAEETEESLAEVTQDSKFDRKNNEKVSVSRNITENGAGGRIKEAVAVPQGKGIVSDKDADDIHYAMIDKDEPSTDVEEITNREAKLKAEREAFLKAEMEANLCKMEIERLADENFAIGEKVFIYPQTVKPDEDVEIFLNRSLSALRDEPDILIMGAFNDWRWKSFTVRLNKTQLKGDWWSCPIHVPKESYKIDFVFFNGQDVYDNNNKNDFCVPIEGGMDTFAFEDFLLEEKHWELEKLAREEAERERQAEEQRRMEAEKAAREADRAQARVEMERKRGILQELMRKAPSSVDGVWYFEPSEFRGKDLVRLYYNQSSGPLVHCNELWIHGGYNNWRDGLSISGRLVKSERKDGDWWYANCKYPFLCHWCLLMKILLYFFALPL